jgi:hypothetical protein
MRKTITIPEGASDGEICDAIEEALERALNLPVTLRRKDVRTIRKVIEAEKRRLRKQPKTTRAPYGGADDRFC